MKREWTPFRALFLLRMEAVRLGRTPSQQDLRRSRSLAPSESTLRKMFGSLTEAQKRARLVPHPHGAQRGWRKKVCKRGHQRTPENLDRQGHCVVCCKITRNARDRRRSA